MNFKSVQIGIFFGSCLHHSVLMLRYFPCIKVLKLMPWIPDCVSVCSIFFLMLNRAQCIVILVITKLHLTPKITYPMHVYCLVIINMHGIGEIEIKTINKPTSNQNNRGSFSRLPRQAQAPGTEKRNKLKITTICGILKYMQNWKQSWGHQLMGSIIVGWRDCMRMWLVLGGSVCDTWSEVVTSCCTQNIECCYLFKIFH